MKKLNFHIEFLRKIISIMFVMLFSITSTGFSVSTHFSFNKFFSYSINDKAESCCSTEKCGCCSENNITVKIVDDYEYPDQVHAKTFLTFVNLPLFSYSSSLIFPNEVSFKIKRNRPPPLLGLTSSSRLQTFRC